MANILSTAHRHNSEMNSGLTDIWKGFRWNKSTSAAHTRSTAQESFQTGILWPSHINLPPPQAKKTSPEVQINHTGCPYFLTGKFIFSPPAFWLNVWLSYHKLDT